MCHCIVGAGEWWQTSFCGMALFASASQQGRRVVAAVAVVAVAAAVAAAAAAAAAVQAEGLLTSVPQCYQGGSGTSGRAAGGHTMVLVGCWLQGRRLRLEKAGMMLLCQGGSGIIKALVVGRKGISGMGMLVSVPGLISSLSVELVVVVGSRGETSISTTAKKKEEEVMGGLGLVGNGHDKQKVRNNQHVVGA